MAHTWRSLMTAGATLLSLARAASPFSPDQCFLLHNATIYTMAAASPYASALCVCGDRIKSVGNDAAVLSSECGEAAARSLAVVDLGGAVMVPGLTDSHAHLMMEAVRHVFADLSEAHSAGDAAQAALEFARLHKKLVQERGWVQGYGWDQSVWPGKAFPTRYDLDKLFPDIPVYMEQLSGHACWVNSRALSLVAAELPAKGDLPGGHIERDPQGRPTGVLADNAMRLMQKHLPPLTDSQADDALSEVLHDCAAHGLTGLHDMDSLSDDVELFQQRHARGNLTLRVYAMRDGAEGSPSQPFVNTSDGLLTVRGVKFFGDGAMGSWSAAMLEPYNDKPNVTGTLVYTEQALHEQVKKWAARGYQIATHAIGDAANRQVLNVYEDLLQYGGLDPRWRVEHAQILSAQDIPRFAKLGVLASMQPSHCASDLHYAVQRLGAERASRAYAWASLLETGVHALPFGSDFPTAGSVPPLLGFHAAVTRETADGVPAGGWFPNQRVTRMQALKGYTADAAYASFREQELGQLQEGFYADVTILDKDILTVEASSILNATVICTIVGGRIVYRAEASSVAPGKLASLAQRTSRRQRPLPQIGTSSRTVSIALRLERWQRQLIRDLHEDRRGDAPPIELSDTRAALWV